MEDRVNIFQNCLSNMGLEFESGVYLYRCIILLILHAMPIFYLFLVFKGEEINLIYFSSIILCNQQCQFFYELFVRWEWVVMT